jgi:hypothetical protein
LRLVDIIKIIKIFSSTIDYLPNLRFPAAFRGEGPIAT